MKDLIFAFFIMVFVLLMIWILFPRMSSDLAVRAIVGEAANQSDDTMVCVAQGIRHRGTFHGVYGVYAKHNQSENSETWQRALDAWEDSAWMTDKIHGAKNWGTEGEIPFGIKVKAVCGELYFY